MTGECSYEVSALDLVRVNMLTAFQHIPTETREVANRTLAAMAEKKAEHNSL